MEKYTPGQTLVYHECGEVTLVKVIADNSTAEEVILELEIVELLQLSAVVKPSKIGDRFTASHTRKYSQSGWYVDEPKDSWIYKEGTNGL